MLMPINEKFIDVFEIFMDDNQKAKIRANNVRQYIEGVIDLLLKDKILPFLKPSEDYLGVNWSRKIKIIKENYDESIAGKIQRIFAIGGEGSHFNGQVTNEDLKDIIGQATHIVEDIFIKYFLAPEHEFGSENIFTIFSMLPLNNRIYILENVYENYKNPHIVDRLSLAYFKYGEKDKAFTLLQTALHENIINAEFRDYQLYKMKLLDDNLPELYKMNEKSQHNLEYSKAIFVDNHLVVGHPPSRDVFETERAVAAFQQWFETDKDKYPEFMNLFLCLMSTDERQYI